MVFCLPFGKKAARALGGFEPESVQEKPFLPAPVQSTRKPSLSNEEARRRIQELAALIQEKKLDFYLVPSGDEHQSEYTATADQRREWLTGFTGSAGTAIISRSGQAWLFVDSRYWVQAGNQSPSVWKIVKLGSEEDKVQSAQEWLLDQDEGARIGIDPKLMAYNAARDFASALEKRESKLVPIKENLVDSIRSDIPLRSLEPIEHHPHKFTGRSATDKLSSIRKTLFTGGNEDDIYILPTLPAIAWLLNLRCEGDVKFTPVFFSYVILTKDRCVFFVDSRKISEDVKSRLDHYGVEMHPYGLDQVLNCVKGMRRDSAAVAKAKVIAPDSASWAMGLEIGDDHFGIIDCPVDDEKGVKNATELEGFRNAYLRDGLAQVRWFAWLESEITHKGAKMTESQIGDKLTEFRSRGKYSRGLAYNNIVGYGPNGALPHYSPIPGEDLIVGTDKPIVVDSGGQYLDGTIDTTRTIFLGKTPSAEHKRAFTRVLQGHICLETTPFPEKTRGITLDTLARQFLFKDGLNYGHGTGHGVGEYLSVHEGPHGVPSNLTFKEGELMSNEPGFYKTGDFGVRTESVILCKEVKTRYGFGGKWLGWERITVVPIDKKLVDFALLSPEEKAWVHDHNEHCKKMLMPLLNEDGDKQARRWLKNC